MRHQALIQPPCLNPFLTSHCRVTQCVAAGHVDVFTQWAAGIRQVFMDEVLGLVIGGEEGKVAWTENQTDGAGSCSK